MGWQTEGRICEKCGREFRTTVGKGESSLAHLCKPCRESYKTAAKRKAARHVKGLRRPGRKRVDSGI